jgi:hypothetical protein
VLTPLAIVSRHIVPRSLSKAEKSSHILHAFRLLYTAPLVVVAELESSTTGTAGEQGK